MTLSRRKLLTAAGVTVAPPAIATRARAQGVVTPRLHHFLPAVLLAKHEKA
jgi:hypothetical protein